MYYSCRSILTDCLSAAFVLYYFTREKYFCLFILLLPGLLVCSCCETYPLTRVGFFYRSVALFFSETKEKLQKKTQCITQILSKGKLALPPLKCGDGSPARLHILIFSSALPDGKISLSRPLRAPWAASFCGSTK